MEKIKFKSIDSEKIFCFSYSIYLIFSLFSKTFLFQYYNVNVYRLIKAFYVALLFYIEYRDKKFDKNRIIGIILCLLLYLNTSYIGGVLSDSLSILILCSSRHAKFDKIAKITVIIEVFVLSLTIVLAKIGIIENYINYEYRVREYLGFLYALFPSMILFNITCLVIYLNREKNIKKIIYKVILLLVANVFVYKLTNSRLSFACSIFLLICFCLFKTIPNLLEKISNWKIYKVLSSYSFIICCILSILIMLVYNPEVTWMNKLSEILGNRIYLMRTSFDRYGFKLFGIKDIAWVGSGLNKYGKLNLGEYLYVDNLYINILQKFGLFFLIVMLILITVTLLKCHDEKKYLIIFILFLISLRCLIDDLQLHLYYNTFLFIIPKMLMDGDENTICDDELKK